jgi:chemotaxis protein MotA
MDRGTIFGCIFGAGFIVFAVAVGGIDNLLLFWNVPAMLIVFGGAFAAVMIAYPLKSVLKLATYISKGFFHKEDHPQKIIEQIVSLSEAARREGILALESRLYEIDDPFLVNGIQMVVDGLPPVTIEKILSSELDSMNIRHNRGRTVISSLGKFTPAFGMIGTLIGLVLMFAHFNPETIGAGMAVAILTTLYGSVVSYLFLLPIAEKLATLNDSELQLREMMLKGITAIQAGEHPRVIRLKLLTCIPPNERPQNETYFETVSTDDEVVIEEKQAA